MAAVDALFELGIDIERHLRVGVADLAHHPLDVEVVGKQCDRDVGAAQAVRRRVGHRRQAAADKPRARDLGCFADDLADALAGQAPTVKIRHQEVFRPGRPAAAPQPVEVLDDRLDEVGRELHLADARLGLRVRDPEAGAVGVVQAHLADPQRAELARAHARATEDLAHHPAANVAAADLGARAAQVMAHGGLRDAELPGDLAGVLALGEHVRDERRGRRELRRPAGRQGTVLISGRVEQARELVHLQEGPLRLRDANAHPLAARGVVVDVAVLDRVVEDRRQRVDQPSHRRRPERHSAPTARVAYVGARLERLADLGGLAQLARLEFQTEIPIDLVEQTLAEERQQVVCEPPAIVACRAFGDRLVAEDAVDLRLQPPRGVLVERRDLRGGRCWVERRWRFRPAPDARAYPRLDVAEFGSGARLVPSATATTFASGSLVQDDELAATACDEAQVERPRAVDKLTRFDRATGGASHQRLPRGWSPERHTRV